MALTTAERAELRQIEAKARQLRAKKNAEAKAAGREIKRQIRSAIDRSQKGQRNPRERDPGYLAFLRRLPCIAGLIVGGCEGPVQAAHVRYSAHGKGRNPGMGNKNHDRHANPLCAEHHLNDQHQRRESAFWSDLGVDAYDLSAALYAAYRSGEDGLAVLRGFSPRKEKV